MSGYILNDDWLAIIAPGFQYENEFEQCSPFQECVEKYSFSFALIKNRVRASIPSTKEELRKCMVEKKYTTFSQDGLFHVY